MEPLSMGVPPVQVKVSVSGLQRVCATTHQPHRSWQPSHAAWSHHGHFGRAAPRPRPLLLRPVWLRHRAAASADRAVGRCGQAGSATPSRRLGRRCQRLRNRLDSRPGCAAAARDQPSVLLAILLQISQHAQPAKAAAAPGSVDVEVVAAVPARPAAPDAGSFSGGVPAAVPQPQAESEQPTGTELDETAADDVAPRRSEPQVRWHGFL